MKKIRNLVLGIFIWGILTLGAYALNFSNPISTELENRSVVSVSIRDLDTNKVKYKKDDMKLLTPASSLKVFTFASILNTLGEDYNFETSIYKDKKDNLYIKLGADPLLNYKNLRSLVREGKEKGIFKKISKIYIDDSIIDKKSYPNGWMSDDLWPNMPKISPYTLNQNKVSITITPSRDLKTVEIFQPDSYKMTILNEVTIGEIPDLSVEKKYGDDNDIVNVKGVISNKETELTIPVNNPKFYFISNLSEILKDEKIGYKKEFFFSETPKDASKVANVSHSIKEVGQSILQDSNNFSAEVAFKVAGGVFSEKQGTTQDGVEMFSNYYNNLGFDTSILKISDGSGVSRYNIFTTDWMSEVLVYLFKNTNIKDYMATPNTGTLKRRLRFLDNRLWAKTGTLNGVSSLCGLVINENDKELVFSIIIQNFSEKTSIIKSFEDDLIDEIFKL